MKMSLEQLLERQIEKAREELVSALNEVELYKQELSQKEKNDMYVEAIEQAIKELEK